LKTTPPTDNLNQGKNTKKHDTLHPSPEAYKVNNTNGHGIGKSNGLVKTEQPEIKNITSEAIYQNAKELLEELNAESGMFRVRTAAQVLKDAASQLDPVELYPHLIVEGEIVICFADTGIGKTVFAVQIAIEISKKHKVLYLDLELSQKQFEKRYRDEHGNHYPFNENFYRVDYTPRFAFPDGIDYDDFFIQSLITAIELTGAKFVVVDNMTKLAASDTDSAKATIPVMAKIARLKDDYDLTLLLLEHNKKVDGSRPIQLNDLQGSKMKANLVDAIFTIGRSSSDTYLRYIKQLKVRDGEFIYDTENVLTCEIIKLEGYLHFRDIGKNGSEFEHLKQFTQENKEERITKAKELSRRGESNREIGRQMGVTEGAVRKWLKK